MFRLVKGPLWAQAYQKNMKADADLGPDILVGYMQISAHNCF